MTIDGYYQNPHQSQYQAGVSARTRADGCTWTTGANGANASTGGLVAKSPDQILALVKPSEETNPATPGWSLPDLAKAMGRLGVPFEVRSGQGFAAVENAHRSGLYLAVQGDSDQFGNGTCSGMFNGDHCIGVHPAERTNPEGTLEWWIDDPICPDGRWESVAVIGRYAEKLDPSVRFGAFTHPVPRPATRFNVAIYAYTPVWDKPNGSRVGAVRVASYLCTRRLVGTQMWYRIISRSDGTVAAWAGKWFKPNSHTKVTRA